MIELTEIKQQILANAMPITLMIQAFLAFMMLVLFAFIHISVKKIRKEKSHFITRI